VNKIRLSTEEIKYITLFETLTGARVKDCVHNENAMGFLIDRGDMGLAIGRNGSNIEKVRSVIGKGVWVMEFSDELNEFVRNLFHPVDIRQIISHKSNDGKMVIVEVSKRDRKKVIGHNGGRIKIAKKLAKRHFNIDDIKIRTV